MKIDKTSADYKAGYAAGNGSAKHYMNYVLCKALCDTCWEIMCEQESCVAAQTFNKNLYIGNRLAEQLGVENIVPPSERINTDLK